MFYFSKIKKLLLSLATIESRLDKLQQAVGRVEKRQTDEQLSYSFNDYEFQVYSQWGEDGLIQYLIDTIIIERPIFVEFGVENYKESNTRFLLVNNNWSGLVIDGSLDNIQSIKKDSIYWRHNLKAECAFITKENINKLIDQNGINGDIGLLSIDVDGNDYWIWDAISVVSPRIVVCEYNSIWGNKKSVTIPYDKEFVRGEAHYSNLYWGASICALNKLAKFKGYSLVGSNRAGNNIFFVRNDLIGELTVISPEMAWVESQFRESRDSDGELTFQSKYIGLLEIANMPLFDLNRDHQYLVSEIYNLK